MSLQDHDNARHGPSRPLEIRARLCYRTHVRQRIDVVVMRTGNGGVRQSELFATAVYRQRLLPGNQPQHTLLSPTDTIPALHYTLATVTSWYDLLNSTIAPEAWYARCRSLHCV